MKRTPFYDLHVKAGARMIAFAGYEMPVQYTGIVDETLWTRKHASLFDVSHMARFSVSGPEALPFLNYSFSNDVSRLGKRRQAQYTLLLNPKGGIHDDAYIYFLREGEYLVVVNAANHEKDWGVLRDRLKGFNADMIDVTEEMAQVALQGPDALPIMAEITGIEDLKTARRNRVFLWRDLIVATTGYTGERGVEVYGPIAPMMELVETLLAREEVRWAGLGARDILRAEAGYPLYGNDIDEDTDPFSANLGWFVKLNKGHFVGREALLNLEVKELRKGFVKEGRGLIPHKGDRIFADGEEVGRITTGVFSPHINGIIAMGYVPKDLTGEVEVESRGRRFRYEVRDYPFVQLPKW